MIRARPTLLQMSATARLGLALLACTLVWGAAVWAMC
jgi:hypothetical protein